MPPQIVASATRMEAAVSTLAVARQAGVPEAEIEQLESGVRKTMSFLMRSQLAPGPSHLMPDAAGMLGGFPTSEVDLRVRIDYPQHAGTALLGYYRALTQK
jgi:hypothetical protein